MRCEIPDIDDACEANGHVNNGAISRVTHSICPITPEEGARWAIPDRPTLQNRIDIVLGTLFELDSNDDSPLKHGWKWRQTRSDFTGLPVLHVTVPWTTQQHARAAIDEILRELQLEETRFVHRTTRKVNDM